MILLHSAEEPDRVPENSFFLPFALPHRPENTQEIPRDRSVIPLERKMPRSICSHQRASWALCMAARGSRAECVIRCIRCVYHAVHELARYLMQSFLNAGRHSSCQWWRDGISDLTVAGGPASREPVVIGESLDDRCFSGGDTPFVASGGESPLHPHACLPLQLALEPVDPDTPADGPGIR